MNDRQRPSIAATLVHAVARHADEIAVVDGDRRSTYAELGRRVEALAGYLAARGVGPGDRVSILDVNSLGFLTAYYAAAVVGAILNPLNHRLAVPELVAILRDAGACWLLAAPEFADRVAGVTREPTDLRGVLWLDEKTPGPAPDSWSSIWREAVMLPAPRASRLEPLAVDADAPAHLYYTSGTTGQPKGVVLTHRNVCRHAEAAIAELGLAAADRWGHIAPMFHLADAWAVFAVTAVGGRHVMLPRFDAERALDLIAGERVTVSNLIPAMLNMMVASPRAAAVDLTSLRLVLSGGAPIAPELVRRVIDTFGCEYVQTYGMTETSPYLTLGLLDERQRALPPDEQLARRARTGRPFATVELRVMRPDGSGPVRADDREVGEIWVRGETVTPGYWNRPEETRAAFAGDWLRTGDLAVVDATGSVNIVDRLKDMIVTGGENVYSVEVEHVLFEHPQVLEAAVVGRPDELWGEVVHAAVVPRPGARVDPGELVAFCRERLAAYKTPAAITVLGELPRTGSGKISKRELRRRLAALEETEPG